MPTLLPVEHNPFAVTLVPVEHDPFGTITQVADRLPYPPGGIKFEPGENNNYGSMAYSPAEWALLKQGAKYGAPPPPPIRIVPK
jgi:hypothetical protein